MKDEKLYQQYADIKAKYPDVVILFRKGDFYITAQEDAVTCSKELGITLTRLNEDREKKQAMFRHLALDIYLPKLVRNGHRVAICDCI